MFLKARHCSAAVIRLVLAFGTRARQHELFGTRRLAFPFTAVQRKKNWCSAFLTLHAEIPPGINLRPLRNMHRFDFPLLLYTTWETQAKD